MTPQQLAIPRTSEPDFPPHTSSYRHATSAFPRLVLPLETSALNQPRTIRVALAGCGVVGGGLVRLLHESAASLASRFGVRFVITTVLVRDTTRDRKLPLDARLLTDDLQAFLDHDADVVVEAVGGDEPARSIAVSALRRGRKLITANKELIANHGDSLHALAAENLTALDFGAAVGGSAPVISTLRDLIGASAPRSVRGILNGTSNFVISEIEGGNSLEAALAAARGRGLAESDCTRDLDGSDAAAKLAIIGWIAFGIKPTELQIRIVPLPSNLEQLVRLAPTIGARLRFIAECTRLDDNRVIASVEPALVAQSSAFARTAGEENRVEVDLGWTSPLAVSGPGAGGAPTAAALLSDLVCRSAPPNDRGNGATKFSPTIDEREHRWLIGARLDIAAFKALAAGSELCPSQVFAHDDYTIFIFERASWTRAEAIVSSLHAVNSSPFLARCELAPVAGRLE